MRVEDSGLATTRPEHLFVVRLWRETAPGGDGQWRGSVDHVTSGRKHYFASMGALVEFMALRLDDPGAKM